MLCVFSKQCRHTVSPVWTHDFTFAIFTSRAVYDQRVIILFDLTDSRSRRLRG